MGSEAADRVVEIENDAEAELCARHLRNLAELLGDTEALDAEFLRLLAGQSDVPEQQAAYLRSMADKLTSLLTLPPKWYNV